MTYDIREGNPSPFPKNKRVKKKNLQYLRLFYLIRKKAYPHASYRLKKTRIHNSCIKILGDALLTSTSVPPSLAGGSTQSQQQC